ncbi:MAG: arylesterase [Burkholderiales bacterium]
MVLWALAYLGDAGAQTPTIVIYGDSLSAGYGLARGTGWVDLLGKRLSQQNYPYRLVNASISGETSLGGKNRIAKVLALHRPAIVVLELGANDGLRGHPNGSLKANLGSIVRACQRSGARVLLVGMRLPPNYGAAYTREFSQTFAATAKQHNLPLVPFLMEGFAQRREMFQSDGVHPNAQAQPAMLDTVWNALAPMLKK